MGRITKSTKRTTPTPRRISSEIVKKRNTNKSRWLKDGTITPPTRRSLRQAELRQHSSNPTWHQSINWNKECTCGVKHTRYIELDAESKNKGFNDPIGKCMAKYAKENPIDNVIIMDAGMLRTTEKVISIGIEDKKIISFSHCKYDTNQMEIQKKKRNINNTIVCNTAKNIYLTLNINRNIAIIDDGMHKTKVTALRVEEVLKKGMLKFPMACNIVQREAKKKFIMEVKKLTKVYKYTFKQTPIMWYRQSSNSDDNIPKKKGCVMQPYWLEFTKIIKK